MKSSGKERIDWISHQIRIHLCLRGSHVSFQKGQIRHWLSLQYMAFSAVEFLNYSESALRGKCASITDFIPPRGLNSPLTEALTG
jgi:hypothetical protein